MSCARTAACAAKLMQGMTHSLVRDSRLVQRNVDLRKRGLLSDETKAVLEDWLEIFWKLLTQVKKKRNGWHHIYFRLAGRYVFMD